MSRFSAVLRKPLFLLAVILPIALLAEFAILEGITGITLPSNRGSAVSSYEIQERGRDVHFITHNKRFSIVDLWSKNGSALEALVLRESFTTDRQDGIEGANSTVKVEALEGKRIKWSFEEAGEQGRLLNQIYEVIKLGCCSAPNTYTYFSLRDGKKLCATHTELNRDQLVSLDQSLYY